MLAWGAEGRERGEVGQTDGVAVVCVTECAASLCWPLPLLHVLLPRLLQRQVTAGAAAVGGKHYEAAPLLTGRGVEAEVSASSQHTRGQESSIHLSSFVILATATTAARSTYILRKRI